MVTPLQKRAPRRGDRLFHRKHFKSDKQQLQVAVNKGLITFEDSVLIARFIRELRATSGISDARATKLITILTGWRSFLPPFLNCTVQDLYKGIGKVRSTSSYKKNTIRDYIALIKRFFRWMAKNDLSGIPLDVLENIKIPPADTMTVQTGDLFSEEEVIRLIRACHSPRDRALISVLYEGGFRIEELATLTWAQVKFDSMGVTIHVNNKTDVPRYVRIIVSTRELATWQQHYPFPIEPDGLVFVNRYGRGLTYDGTLTLLKKIALRAGITKRMRPHLLRHSRVTHLQRAVPEAVIKKMMWGNQRTKMLATYSHISDGDVDNAILALHGLSSKEHGAPSAFIAIVCKNCQEINGPASTLCWKCGMPLENEKS